MLDRSTPSQRCYYANPFRVAWHAWNWRTLYRIFYVYYFLTLASDISFTHYSALSVHCSAGSEHPIVYTLALFLSNIIFPRPLEQHQPPTIIYWWLCWGVLTGGGEDQVPTIGVQRPCWTNADFRCVLLLTGESKISQNATDIQRGTKQAHGGDSI